MAGPDDGNPVILRLSRLLASAIRQASALDIAVVLGSGAELQYFPDDRTLDLCTLLVQRQGGKAMRAVVWTVRHRCVRLGAGSRRFAVKDV